MKYLLDTHALIWFSENDSQLPERVKLLIENYNNEFYISIATLWEMSIKISKGSLIINKTFDEIIKIIFSNGFLFLPITFHHTRELLTLPVIHKDPFDRMLITQTLYENMTIISKEDLFDNYKVNRFW